VETATQRLHRLTSYSPGREWDEPIDDPAIVQSFKSNDMETFPWFYKRYPDRLDRLELPRELPKTSDSCLSVLAGTARAPQRDLDLNQLSRLLHLSAGIVRTMERRYGTHLFRAAGSAGGRFPLELYVAIPAGGRLSSGVFWYHPEEHVLLQVGPPPRGEHPSLIVTGVPWRTGWRYRERGFRHVYWDAGTMLAQTIACAQSSGIPARLYTRFPDESVRALVSTEGVDEWPVAVVGLGAGAPALQTTGPAEPGETDATPLELPLATAAQSAGEGAALGEPWDWGAPVSLAARDARPVEEVVLTRGSQRRLDPAGVLPRSTLETAMAVAMRGIEQPHFIAVHSVDGLAPGIYRWPHLEAPIRTGNFREELYRVSLDQGLARDAAFVVIGATDVSRLDDTAYREAQLAAGLVEGRLHLAAYALGASASGMTFLDSEIPTLIGEPLDGLLFTCVGVPEYKSAPGGQPGAPTAIRGMQPRL